MTNYPFMPFYVADFQADTMHLDWKEKAAYRALLDVYWLLGKGPKNNDKQLSQIIGMTADEWYEVRENVLEFFTEVDGRLVQKRMELEIAEAKARTSAAQEKANKRWKKDEEPPESSPSNATAVPQHEPGMSPSNANAMQSTSTSTSTSKIKTPVAPKADLTDFEPVNDFDPNPTPTQVPAVAGRGGPDALFTSLRKAFQSKNPNSWPKPELEIKALEWLVLEAKTMAQDLAVKPEECALILVTKFWELRANGRDFWRRQPFQPTRMKALWGDLMAEIEKAGSLTVDDGSWIDEYRRGA